MNVGASSNIHWSITSVSLVWKEGKREENRGRERKRKVFGLCSQCEAA